MQEASDELGGTWFVVDRHRSPGVLLVGEPILETHEIVGLALALVAPLPVAGGAVVLAIATSKARRSGQTVRNKARVFMRAFLSILLVEVVAGAVFVITKF